MVATIEDYSTICLGRLISHHRAGDRSLILRWVAFPEDAKSARFERLSRASN